MLICRAAVPTPPLPPSRIVSPPAMFTAVVEALTLVMPDLLLSRISLLPSVLTLSIVSTTSELMKTSPCALTFSAADGPLSPATLTSCRLLMTIFLIGLTCVTFIVAPVSLTSVAPPVSVSVVAVTDAICQVTPGAVLLAFSPSMRIFSPAWKPSSSQLP